MSLAWKQAEKDFEESFSSYAHVFPFHDALEAKKSSGIQRVFTTSHPADYIVTNNGVTFYAEVKSCSHEVRFAFSNIKKSQWNAATRLGYAKGLYFFYVKNENTGQWYRIPGDHFVNLHINKGLKSVTWDSLDPFKFNLLQHRHDQRN